MFTTYSSLSLSLSLSLSQYTLQPRHFLPFHWRKRERESILVTLQTDKCPFSCCVKRRKEEEARRRRTIKVHIFSERILRRAGPYCTNSRVRYSVVHIFFKGFNLMNKDYFHLVFPILLNIIGPPGNLSSRARHRLDM